MSVAVSVGIGFGVSILLGYFLVSLLWPSGLPRTIVWAFAPGIGAGLSSLIFFAFRRPMFTVEFALLIILAPIWFFRRSVHPASNGTSVGPPASWRVPIALLALAGALGASLPGFMLRMERAPHGISDGWAIWNSHARVLYREGPRWKEGIQHTFLPDYPLLTPSLTARLWRYAGEDPPEAGAWLGIMFLLSAVAVLVVTLSHLRDTSLAVVMGLVLLSTPLVLHHATTQFADVPLAFFVLATIALICLYSEDLPDGRGLLVLAGFTAGCAGWTKNEGLLFIVAVCVALLAPALRRPAKTLHRFIPFFVGMILPLAVIVLFKFAVGQSNYMMYSRNSQELAQKVFDVNRHVTILKSFATTLWTFGVWSVQPLVPLAAFIILRGADRGTIRSFGWRTSVGVLSLVVAGYYLVYLTTPIELNYHLVSSLDRLIIHIWPSLFLVAGLMARTITGRSAKP
jgi:hypothetical protein